jgi:hypothetical protein
MDTTSGYDIPILTAMADCHADHVTPLYLHKLSLEFADQQ